MKHFWHASAAILFLVLAAAGAFWQMQVAPKKIPQNAFPAQFRDRALFDYAFKTASTTPRSSCIAELIVPHHLLAADLIARAITVASGREYAHVIILSPDHYAQGTTKISVAARDFLTVYGRLATNAESAARLSLIPQAASADFFYKEHGIGGILPFVKKTWPSADVVAIAIRSDTRPNELESLLAALKKESNDQTLIIGSTDFSHYLTAADAAKKDAETEAVFTAGNPSAVWGLSQPDHLDARGVLYVVWSLAQAAGNSMQILDHRNSQYYTTDFVSSTTSYFTILFSNQSTCQVTK